MKGLRNIVIFLFVGGPAILLGLLVGVLIPGKVYQLAGYSGLYASPNFPSGQDWISIPVFIATFAYVITWVIVSIRYSFTLARSGKVWDIRDSGLLSLLVTIIVAATLVAATVMAISTGLYLVDRLAYVRWLAP